MGISKFRNRSQLNKDVLRERSRKYIRRLDNMEQKVCYISSSDEEFDFPIPQHEEKIFRLGAEEKKKDFILQRENFKSNVAASKNFLQIIKKKQIKIFA